MPRPTAEGAADRGSFGRHCTSTFNTCESLQHSRNAIRPLPEPAAATLIKLLLHLNLVPHPDPGGVGQGRGTSSSAPVISSPPASTGDGSPLVKAAYDLFSGFSFRDPLVFPAAGASAPPDAAGVTAQDAREDHDVRQLLAGQGLAHGKNKPEAKFLATVARYLSDGKEDAFPTLARTILKAGERYGGEEGEPLSAADAVLAVRQWFFRHCPGMSPAQYVAEKLRNESAPGDYTLGQLREALSFSSVMQGRCRGMASLSEPERARLSALWDTMVREEMPVLRFSDGPAAAIPLSSEAFAQLYAGAAFLAGLPLSGYTLEEAAEAGKAMWSVALAEDISEVQMGSFMVPAMFFAAADRSRGLSTADLTGPEALSVYLQYHYEERVRQTLSDYDAAAGRWAKKEPWRTASSPAARRRGRRRRRTSGEAAPGACFCRILRGSAIWMAWRSPARTPPTALTGSTRG